MCVATDFYPDHVAVSWKINNETVTSGVGTENSAHSLNKMYSISSRLRVKKSVWQNTANTFTCSVQFFDGEDNVTVTDIIHGQSGEYQLYELKGGIVVILTHFLSTDDTC